MSSGAGDKNNTGNNHHQETGQSSTPKETPPLIATSFCPRIITILKSNTVEKFVEMEYSDRYSSGLVSFAQHYLHEIHLLLLQMAVVCSFSVLCSTPLCEHTTTYPALGGHSGYFQKVCGYYE